MKIVPAPTARAAMAAPSSSRWGSCSSSTRSLKVPGSPSSALTTTYLSLPGASRTARHLMCEGNPAPPRPARPEPSISLMTSSAFFQVGPAGRAVGIGDFVPFFESEVMVKDDCAVQIARLFFQLVGDHRQRRLAQKAVAVLQRMKNRQQRRRFIAELFDDGFRDRVAGRDDDVAHGGML